MFSAKKSLAFFKVLAALAWADGELSNCELNYIKNLALKFRLPDKEWHELEPYLYDAVTKEESQNILQEFLSLSSGTKDKKNLLDSLKEMANADEEVSPDEERFLSEANKLIESHSGVKDISGAFKSLFSTSIISGQTPSKTAQDFSKNKILYVLKRRIKQGKMSPVEPERLKYLALWGGLLGRVAYADHDFSEKELKHLKLKLNKLGTFSPHEASLVAMVIHDTTLKGVDNARMAADFFQISTEKQRLQLLETLFELAAADGKVSGEEIEEIRVIANTFGLSHKQFIDAKLAAKNAS